MLSHGFVRAFAAPNRRRVRVAPVVRLLLPTEPRNAGEQEAVVRRLGAYLQRVALAWHDASPEQRIKLARSLFQELRIMDE